MYELTVWHKSNAQVLLDITFRSKRLKYYLIYSTTHFYT